MGRIDVHSHYTTPRYRKEAEDAAGGRPDGMPGLPDWEPEMAIETMDRLGVETAMLSISSPGVHFGDDESARALARHVNEAAAQAVADHPRRFGLFASLPLPDLDAALTELDYAFGELRADGIALMTNFNGTYLGDGSLEPLYEELDRRGAVAFIHPTSPCCWGPTSLGFPRPMIEFVFDTTRTVTNLILNGVRRRFPNIELIVPHAGAALPLVADRIAMVVDLLPTFAHVATAADVLEAFEGLWYDLAGPVTPRQLPALLDLVESGRLLFGSDWPFTPEALAVSLSKALDDSGVLSADQLRAIHRDNALNLFPRLREASSGRQ